MLYVVCDGKFLIVVVNVFYKVKVNLWVFEKYIYVFVLEINE